MINESRGLDEGILKLFSLHMIPFNQAPGTKDGIFISFYALEGH